MHYPTWKELAGIIIAISSLYGAYNSRKNGEKLAEIHISLNSRMDTALKEAINTGRQIERDSQKESGNVG
jgi:hypothetical protein